MVELEGRKTRVLRVPWKKASRYPRRDRDFLENGQFLFGWRAHAAGHASTHVRTRIGRDVISVAYVLTRIDRSIDRPSVIFEGGTKIIEKSEKRDWPKRKTGLRIAV